MSGLINTTGAKSGVIGTTSGSISAASIGLGKAITYRLVTAVDNSADPLGPNTADWEVSDDTEFEGPMGTPVTQASGIFTFAETGHYLTTFNGYCVQTNGGNDWAAGYIYGSNNGSGGTYTNMAQAVVGSFNQDGQGSFTVQVLVDVTSVTGGDSCHIKIVVGRGGGTTNWSASTSHNTNSVTFIKLGNT